MRDKDFLLTIFLLSGIFLFAINLGPVIYFAASDVLPGWDGSSHLAVGQLYSGHIFPKTWGWLSQWYLGMPFPQFYPPAFYFMTALVSHLLFFLPYNVVFRGFVLATLFVVPGTIAWCGYRLSGDRKVATVTALLSTLYLSYYNGQAACGVNVVSTINNGLCAHALGFLFFVVWIRNVFQEPLTQSRRITSAVWLSLAVLSDVHLVLPAFILFWVRAGFELWDAPALGGFGRLRQILFGYALHGLLALGIGAFWLLPLLTHFQYFQSTAIPMRQEEYFHLLSTFFYLPSCVAGGLYMATVRKQRELVMLAAGILALYAVVLLSYAFAPKSGGSLPMHFLRWIAPILYLSPILSARFMVGLWEDPSRRWAAAGLLSLLMIISFNEINAPFRYKTLAVYFASGPERFNELIRYMQGAPKGLVLVEADSGDAASPRTFAENARLGSVSVPTTFANGIRESAMSGLYLTPLRNMVSAEYEHWGMTSFLAQSYSFVKRLDWKTKLDMVRYFRVKYMIATSPQTVQALLGSGDIRMLRHIGPFFVFDLEPAKPAGPLKTLEMAPVALFAPLGLQNRQRNDLTFSRFSEEWLKNFDPDVVYVMPKTLSIEGNPVFDIVRQAVLVHYTYQNLDAAVNQLTRFAAHGTLILFDAKDRLSQALKERQIGNIIYLPLPNDDHDLTSIYPEIQTLLKRRQLEDARAEAGRPHPRFLLFKQSYFPEWKAVDGSDVYLASPSFVLAVPKGEEIHMVFSTPPSVYAGYAVSILALMSLISLGLMYERRKE